MGEAGYRGARRAGTKWGASGKPGRRLRLHLLTAAVATVLGAAPAVAAASPTPSFTLVIRHQAFVPATLRVPAGRLVKLMVTNKDALPAEFESDDFNREEVVPGGISLPVYVGPFKPGRYTFFNDFHPSSTGVLIAVPARH
ncbi:MAG: cupredoxin domain-containing protein [Magnetospirillum sp.]|nr:cupredoxin domain-containing protein [Magnetospirillum sp.]